MRPWPGLFVSVAVCLWLGCAGPVRGLAGRPQQGSAQHLAGTGGSGPEDEEAAAPRRREAEAARAVAEMWRVTAPIQRVGAQVEFSFWAHRGALTMLAWRRTGEGTAPGAEARFETFSRALRPLPAFAAGSPGALQIVARREEAGWSLSSVQLTPFAGDARPEARTLPVDAPEIPAGPFAALEKEARIRWLQLLQVPAQGKARLELTVEFDDARAVGATERYQSEGRGVRLGAPVGFETEVAGALVPFTQGIGRRKVKVVLEASREPGDLAPAWRVREVATLRPARGESNEAFTTASEYRRMHEQILRQWREGVGDAVTMAAVFSAEQIAVWIAGGLLLRGVGFALELAEGPLLRVLGRAGPEAADWLYCLLKRAPKAERDALIRLWTRVETEGLEALTAAEKAELRAGLQRLEQLAKTPLGTKEKIDLRKIARERLWEHLRQIDPKLPSKLVNPGGEAYQVHHRFTLEWAHLDPEADVNALSNLVALEKAVHKSINRIWTSLRTTRPNPSLSEVKQVVTIVDRYYSRWYNVACDGAREAAALQAAEDAALSELRTSLTRMEGR